MYTSYYSLGANTAYILYMYVAIPWILNTVEGDRCVIGTLDWSKTNTEYKYVSKINFKPVRLPEPLVFPVHL